MYNGYPFEINSNNEFENLGVDEIGKRIVGRGVLIDLPIFLELIMLRLNCNYN